MEAIFELENICVTDEVDIRSTLLALQKCGLGIILVIKNKNKNKNKLIGTITDGDIRRGLLDGKDLSSNVESIMNKNFYFINEKDNLIEAQKNLVKKGLKHLPVLDQEGSLIKLLISKNISRKKILPNAVVIMAGGKGTRLDPFTRLTRILDKKASSSSGNLSNK